MKAKKLEKKLQLNKETVTNLDNGQMKGAKGGTDTDRTCDACDSFVSCEWSLCPICDSIPDTQCCDTYFTCPWC